MIIRRCSQGHRVRIHKNNSPGATRIKKYRDGTTETLTYPSSYNYFVDVDGEVVKRSNSFKTIEEYFVSECAKKHSDGHGKMVVGTHQKINGVVTVQSDYPTDANTKAEIKNFYDKRGIAYGSSETKSELLSRIFLNKVLYKDVQQVTKYLKL